MKKKLVFLIIFGILFIGVGITLYYYDSNLSSVNEKKSLNDEEQILFTINPGETGKQIIDNLYDANLINNKNVVYIYYKLKGNISLQAGTYMLNRDMNVEDIINKFKKGEIVEEIVQITFLEGKSVSRYVSLLAKGFNFTEEEIYAKINDVAFLKQLISKYWFLNDDILKKEIYYPLEGYLYPDTYIFDKNATIEEIIEKILDNTAVKLADLKEEINTNNYSVHDLLTIASIIELEGTNKENRESISQVIYNRLKDNWALGMDVTAYYGVKKDLTDIIYQADLDNKNPYNTRLQDGSMNGKLPVGPICNAGLESIVAALRPSKSNYYFFVANVCTGEVFFQENAMDFAKKCNELRTICNLN